MEYSTTTPRASDTRQAAGNVHAAYGIAYGHSSTPELRDEYSSRSVQAGTECYAEGRDARTLRADLEAIEEAARLLEAVKRGLERELSRRDEPEAIEQSGGVRA